MGSRFTRCFKMNPKVMTDHPYTFEYEGNTIFEHKKAVALNLDKSGNENPTIVGLDWNEV